MDEHISRAEFEELKREAGLLRARGEVANVFGRYQYAHAAIDDELHLRTLWAREQEEVTAEFGNSGVFVGIENISRYFEARAGRNPGKMICHAITTPVIEVAGDGKTAKGLWIATGHVTTASGGPEWVWQRYAIDFARESDGWKIWHFRSFELFRSPYYEDWVSFAKKRDEAETAASNMRLDRPPFQRPGRGYWRYSPDAAAEPIPVPEPYGSFEETFSY